MSQRNPLGHTKEGAVRGGIVPLGVVQIVIALLVVSGYIVLVAAQSFVLTFALIAALVVILLIGAVVSVVNLYTCVVYLLEGRPSRRNRTVAIGCVALSIGLLLVSTWVGANLIFTF